MVLRPKAPDRKLKILRRDKNCKLYNKVISPKRSKNFCIAYELLKIVYLKTDSSLNGIRFLGACLLTVSAKN
jgi:hypothetical protein